MSAKKLVGLLIPLKAMSPRNFTSLALVAVFFAIYILAGGKIQSAPKVEAGRSFGGVRGVRSIPVTGDTAQPKQETATSDIGRSASDASLEEDESKISKNTDGENVGAFDDFQNRINRIGREDN